MYHFLNNDITFIKGVGPKLAELFQQELGIYTYKDLLYYFPYRHIDARALNQIAQVNSQMEYVQLRGIISNIRIEGSGRGQRLVAEFADTTGAIDLIWFQGVRTLANMLEPGTVYNLVGKLTVFNNTVNIVHPELEKHSATNNNKQLPFLPLYSSSEKLKKRGINNKLITKLIKKLLDELATKEEFEYLPERIKKEQQLISHKEALMNIHFPSSQEWFEAAVYRLKFQELLAAQLKVFKLKIKNSKIRGFKFDHIGKAFNDFYNNELPFELTNAQKRVVKEIRENTRTGFQMNRLIQGDVGSGKTIVALLTILIAIDNSFQACMMAPTEILAKQHFLGISELLSNSPIKVALLTGSIKGKERKLILESLASGDLHIIIGTHALVEDKVIFKNLGLAIIDEQHRFGVAQRSKLWKKNTLPPHIMVMTATPIPRTLAMTTYGDLDLSVINELPPGRKPVQTIHRFENYRSDIMQFIRSEIDKGRQVYIVYPLINESEKLDYESLYEGYEQVKIYFPHPQYNIAMVHGQQDKETKDSNMRKFVAGEAHILVSTTVIEVGVNVPNASVMVIESSERFGLSQLHQLRGRVGRGAEKSYCILMTGFKISEESKMRMQIMTNTNDGFKISEEDLKMRGPGDIYGTKQSGAAIEFQLASIIDDIDIIELARNVAQKVLEKDAELETDHYRPLQWLINHYTQSKENIKWDNIS